MDTTQDDGSSPFLQGLLDDYSKSIVPSTIPKGPTPVVPMSPWSSRNPASVGAPEMADPNVIAQQKAQALARPNKKPPVVETDLQNKIADPDKIKALLDMFQNSPGIKDQIAATSGLQDTMHQNMLDQLAASSSYAQPLLRLGDAFNHTNVAQGYTGTTPQDVSKQLLAYQTAIANQKQNTAKDLLSGLNTVLKDKTGSTQIKIGNDTTGFGGVASARDRQLVAQAGERIDNDPILKPAQSAVNNIDRALEILNGNAPITATAFNILGNDMANALAPGGVATEGKISRELPTSIQKTINELEQHYGDIKDLRSNSGATAQLVQLQNLLSQAKGQYAKAANDRLDEKEATYRAIPTDIMQDMLDRKIPILRSKFQNQAAAKNIQMPEQSMGQKLLSFVGKGPTYQSLLGGQQAPAASAAAPTPDAAAAAFAAEDARRAARKAAK